MRTLSFAAALALAMCAAPLRAEGLLEVGTWVKRGDDKVMTVENEYSGGGGVPAGKRVEYWDRC